jgi:hypothetical protein
MVGEHGHIVGVPWRAVAVDPDDGRDSLAEPGAHVFSGFALALRADRVL